MVNNLFKFSAKESDLTPFVGNEAKVKILFDINPTLKSTTKGFLSLFNYFIEMSPTLMSPFLVEKTCFLGKKWTH